MDNQTLNDMLGFLSSFVSNDTANTILGFIFFIVTMCSVVTRFWKPPAVGSKMEKVYKIVSYIAQARGWATAAYQPGKKSIMVPVETNRKDAEDKLGLQSGTSNPK